MAIGKLLLKLGIDTTNLDKELGKVERSMSKFGQNMQNIGSTLTQSLTLPIIALGAASLKSFADMEKLENGLIAIMGSSKEAGIEMEKLRKVAENPGLALPEVVKASASLQSVGMNADAARETITQFGNAVARAGGGAEQFDGVVLALSQISAVGKVTQEDLNQIKERLPEFARVMKEEFGVVTAEGIRELGISSEEFITRSVSALSELERAKGGLGNAFDNLKDNVAASLAELGKVINTSLNVESVFIALSDKLNYLVQGFKGLKPEVQSFIVYAGLIVAAIGPAIFIIGTLIKTFGSLVGTVILIRKTIIAFTVIVSKAFASLLANPVILGIVVAIAAIGAVALYVYDNWQAFSDRFTNIWINIKNSANKGVADFMMAIDKLQKKLGYQLFDVSGLTSYTEEQKIVQKEFKSIGETIDSLSGKFKNLFKAAPKAVEVEEIIKTKKKTPPSPLGDGVSPVNQLMPTTNLLPSITKLPEQLNSATAATQRLKEETNAFAIAQTAAGNAIQYTDEKIKLLQDSFAALNAGIKNIIDTTLNDLANSLGTEIGNALSGAGFSLRSFIGPLADALGQVGKLAIQTGITAAGIKLALKPPINPAVAIAGGIALVALSSLVKNKLSAPALAEGGLATGPTMALVGDNRNARVDPEVIAPLSKLKGMMGDMGIGGTLETRISGNDLIILLNRSQKGLNRVQ